jgi:4'-phosphopantetheinyl transferase
MHRFLTGVDTRMHEKKSCDVQIWRASTGHIGHARWRELTSCLDLAERSQAFKFRQEVDRKAYVLAHGLRRLALSAMLDVAPSKLAFRSDKNGKPQLVEPAHQRLYFSHSHTRHGALFVASTDVAVGIDAESVGTEPLGVELLRPFLVCPELIAGKKNGAEASFYRYWTALEAFSKAVGTGLSSSHPRLLFVPDAQGDWNVQFDAPHSLEMAALANQAVVMRVNAPVGCVASLAIIRPPVCPAEISLPMLSGEKVPLVIHEKELTADFAVMRRK